VRLTFPKQITVYIFEWSTTQLRSLQHDPLINGCIIF